MRRPYRRDVHETRVVFRHNYFIDWQPHPCGGVPRVCPWLKIRKTDTLYRVGGEEFIIICKNTIKSDAIIIAEKIRKKVEESLNIIENKTITISIGVTEVISDDDENSIYKRVDDNLYMSKNSGKNRVTSN
jgi:diguanylate cyclase (GGDEF)-like protein